MTREALRILYVLPYVPSPIRVRPYQIIRHLVRAGHRVTVAALGEGGPEEAAAVEALRGFGVAAVDIVPHPKARAMAQALAALPTPAPLWAAWCRSPEMERRLRERAASGAFDIAHVEHLRAAHFARTLGGLPRVLDAVDCITDLRRQLMDVPGAGLGARLLSAEEWIKLRRYEPRVLNSFPLVAVTTPADADALVALGVTPARLTVIPNGVDTDAEAPRLAAAPGDIVRWDLLFAGRMRYAPNDDAARFLLNEILPRLDALTPPDRPRATVCIAGSGPGAELRRAAARWGERVTITGYVDDLRPYRAASRIALCPLRAGVGMQNKALEAMAAGLPVVATPLVARALTGAEASGALRTAPDAAGLARAVADWLADPAGAAQAGRAGRAFVRARYRWEETAAAFVRLYNAARSGCGTAAAPPAV